MPLADRVARASAAAFASAACLAISRFCAAAELLSPPSTTGGRTTGTDGALVTATVSICPLNSGSIARSTESVAQAGPTTGFADDDAPLLAAEGTTALLICDDSSRPLLLTTRGGGGRASPFAAWCPFPLRLVGFASASSSSVVAYAR